MVVDTVLPSNTYRITRLSNKTGRHNHTTTAHVDQLKLWLPRERENYESESEED